MIGQKGSWLWASEMDGSNGHSVTSQVKNRDVFAEIALHDIWVRFEEAHSSMAYISQIVSDSGVENFEDDPVPRIFRKNVTSVTFRIHVINCYASARWMINFWS